MDKLELKMRKLRARYPDICQISNFDKDKFMQCLSQVTDKPFEIIQFSGELLNYIALAKVIKDGNYQSYMFMNAYELIDIYLGNKSDLKCISDIEATLVIVYLGYSEFENKRQCDVMEQLFEMQRVHRRKFWVLYRGSSIESKYQRLVDAFKAQGYPVTKISDRVVSSVGEDEI